MPSPGTPLPCSEACLRNREPILDTLRTIAVEDEQVLEIGAGTGQHAVFLADALGVDWQPSDVAGNLPGIAGWIEASGAQRVLPPLELDVFAQAWPSARTFDGVFSANTAHILPWRGVEAMLDGVGRILRPGGWFALYGPFNENGAFTSEGNERLDAWARATFPGGGIRERRTVEERAAAVDLAAEANVTMPANNRLLVFRRRPEEGSTE